MNKSLAAVTFAASVALSIPGIAWADKPLDGGGGDAGTVFSAGVFSIASAGVAGGGWTGAGGDGSFSFAGCFSGSDEAMTGVGSCGESTAATSLIGTGVTGAGEGGGSWTRAGTGSVCTAPDLNLAGSVKFHQSRI